MSFYTNVLRYKNYILHRGYQNNGERFMRKEYFQPTLFVSSKKNEQPVPSIVLKIVETEASPELCPL